MLAVDKYLGSLSLVKPRTCRQRRKLGKVASRAILTGFSWLRISHYYVPCGMSQNMFPRKAELEDLFLVTDGPIDMRAVYPYRASFLFPFSYLTARAL